MFGQVSRQLALLEAHGYRAGKPPFRAGLFEFCQEVHFFDVDEVPIAEFGEVGFLEELCFAGFLQGLDHGPDLDVDFGFLCYAKDGLQRDRVNRQPGLLRELAGQERKHLAYARPRDDEFEDRSLAVVKAGQDEVAALVIDSRAVCEAVAVLPERVVGEPAPEALFGGLPAREDARRVHQTLFVGALVGGELLEQVGAGRLIFGLRHLSRAFERPHGSRRVVEEPGEGRVVVAREYINAALVLLR
ncbi:MAG: hypothetical protein H6R26_3510 [Proteobacteria bacterium]|nr:hypothetical protein [Pseudomonadota bacterium]